MKKSNQALLPTVGSTQWTSQGDKEAKLGHKQRQRSGTEPKSPGKERSRPLLHRVFNDTASYLLVANSGTATCTQHRAVPQTEGISLTE